jgi:hypothetical protein
MTEEQKEQLVASFKARLNELDNVYCIRYKNYKELLNRAEVPHSKWEKICRMFSFPRELWKEVGHCLHSAEDYHKIIVEEINFFIDINKMLNLYEDEVFLNKLGYGIDRKNSYFAIKKIENKD